MSVDWEVCGCNRCLLVRQVRFEGWGRGGGIAQGMAKCGRLSRWSNIGRF